MSRLTLALLVALLGLSTGAAFATNDYLASVASTEQTAFIGGSTHLAAEGGGGARPSSGGPVSEGARNAQQNAAQTRSTQQNAGAKTSSGGPVSEGARNAQQNAAQTRPSAGGSGGGGDSRPSGSGSGGNLNRSQEQGRGGSAPMGSRDPALGSGNTNTNTNQNTGGPQSEAAREAQAQAAAERTQKYANDLSNFNRDRQSSPADIKAAKDAAEARLTQKATEERQNFDRDRQGTPADIQAAKNAINTQPGYRSITQPNCGSGCNPTKPRDTPIENNTEYNQNQAVRDAIEEAKKPQTGRGAAPVGIDAKGYTDPTAPGKANYDTYRDPETGEEIRINPAAGVPEKKGPPTRDEVFKMMAENGYFGQKLPDGTYAREATNPEGVKVVVDKEYGDILKEFAANAAEEEAAENAPNLNYAGYVNTTGAVVPAGLNAQKSPQPAANSLPSVVSGEGKVSLPAKTVVEPAGFSINRQPPPVYAGQGLVNPAEAAKVYDAINKAEAARQVQLKADLAEYGQAQANMRVDAELDRRDRAAMAREQREQASAQGRGGAQPPEGNDPALKNSKPQIPSGDGMTLAQATDFGSPGTLFGRLKEALGIADEPQTMDGEKPKADITTNFQKVVEGTPAPDTFAGYENLRDLVDFGKPDLTDAVLGVTGAPLQGGPTALDMRSIPDEPYEYTDKTLEKAQRDILATTLGNDPNGPTYKSLETAQTPNKIADRLPSEQTLKVATPKKGQDRLPSALNSPISEVSKVVNNPDTKTTTATPNNTLIATIKVSAKDENVGGGEIRVEIDGVTGDVERLAPAGQVAKSGWDNEPAVSLYSGEYVVPSPTGGMVVITVDAGTVKGVKGNIYTKLPPNQINPNQITSPRISADDVKRAVDEKKPASQKKAHDEVMAAVENAKVSEKNKQKAEADAAAAKAQLAKEKESFLGRLLGVTEGLPQTVDALDAIAQERAAKAKEDRAKREAKIQAYNTWYPSEPKVTPPNKPEPEAPDVDTPETPPVPETPDDYNPPPAPEQDQEQEPAPQVAENKKGVFDTIRDWLPGGNTPPDQTRGDGGRADLDSPWWVEEQKRDVPVATTTAGYDRSWMDALRARLGW